MSERRTALITGASSGFGAEFARLFARDRFDVVLVARSGPTMRELAEQLQGSHAITATVIAKDLGAAGACDELIADLAERDIQIDALVNNAGFAQYGPFVEADPDQLDQMLSVNVAALTQLTRALLPGMVDRGGDGSSTSARSVRSRPPRCPAPMPPRRHTSCRSRWP